MMRWCGASFTQPRDDDQVLAYFGDDRIVEIDFYVADEPGTGSDDEIEPGWRAL